MHNSTIYHGISTAIIAVAAGVCLYGANKTIAAKNAEIRRLRDDLTESHRIYENLKQEYNECLENYNTIGDTILQCEQKNIKMWEKVNNYIADPNAKIPDLTDSAAN